MERQIGKLGPGTPIRCDDGGPGGEPAPSEALRAVRHSFLPNLKGSQAQRAPGGQPAPSEALRAVRHKMVEPGGIEPPTS